MATLGPPIAPTEALGPAKGSNGKEKGEREDKINIVTDQWAKLIALVNGGCLFIEAADESASKETINLSLSNLDKLSSQ